MPGTMPGHVAKGAILAKLDEALNDLGPGGKRAEFHQRISARDGGKWTEDLVTVAASILPLSALEEAHLRQDWFDPHHGWWLKQQPLDIVVRLGLIHAIELANGEVGEEDDVDDEAGGDAPTTIRPIAFYWVCGVPGFALTSCVSDAQVTTIFITPGRPASDRLPEDYTGMERIFTTRHQSLTPGEKLLGEPVEHVEFVQVRRE